MEILRDEKEASLLGWRERAAEILLKHPFRIGLLLVQGRETLHEGLQLVILGLFGNRGDQDVVNLVMEFSRTLNVSLVIPIELAPVVRNTPRLL